MGQSLVTLTRDVTPNWDEDIPRCSTDECPSFDGKRCRKLGHRPDGICEPAVVEIGKALKNLRAEQWT